MNIRTPSQPNGFASIAITKEKSCFETLFNFSERKEYLFLGFFTRVVSFVTLFYFWNTFDLKSEFSKESLEFRTKNFMFLFFFITENRGRA